MHSAIEELKTRADLILARAKQGDATMLAKFKKLPSLAKLNSSEPGTLKRKHALWLVALEFGFSTWKQASEILNGQSHRGDYGTLLYPKSSMAFLNNWYSDYLQAKACRETTDGYLLPYKRQFVVVSADYICSLGLDPDGKDFKAMGKDWTRPESLKARERLYAQLIANHPRVQAKRG